MRNDPGGTGAVPSLTSKEILEATRGIEAITGVETESGRIVLDGRVPSIPLGVYPGG